MPEGVSTSIGGKVVLRLLRQGHVPDVYRPDVVPALPEGMVSEPRRTVKVQVLPGRVLHAQLGSKFLLRLARPSHFFVPLVCSLAVEKNQFLAYAAATICLFFTVVRASITPKRPGRPRLAACRAERARTKARPERRRAKIAPRASTIRRRAKAASAPAHTRPR